MKTEEALMMKDGSISKDNAAECIRKLQALLDGKTLQFNDCGHWYDATSISPHELLKARVKPEPVTAWYRVAEFKKGVVVVESDEQESSYKRHLEFIRWLTDRVTYEVTE